MAKKTLTILLFFLSRIAITQPVLTSSNFPELPTAIHFHNQDTTGISEGSAGSGIVWDFTTLSTLPEQYIVTYESPNGKQFSSNYPFSNLYETDSSELTNTFYEKNSDSLVIHGTTNRVSEAMWTYTEVEKILKFPFSFQESYTDTFYGQKSHADFVHSGEPAFRNGSVSVEYDGYGTLMLPGMSYNNAMRIKRTETYHDSVCIVCSIDAYRIDDVIKTTFEWYVDTISHPLLRIQYTDLLINSTTQDYDTTVVVYEDQAQTITSKPEPLSSQVSIFYDNVQKELKLKEATINDIKSLKVVNLQGLEFYPEFRQGSEWVYANLQEITPGLYLVFIQLDSGQVVQKKIVVL